MVEEKQNFLEVRALGEDLAWKVIKLWEAILLHNITIILAIFLTLFDAGNLALWQFFGTNFCAIFYSH